MPERAVQGEVACAPPGRGVTLLLVLLVLAAYRLARLVSIDAVFDEPRQWLERSARREGFLGRKLAALVVCPFCTGAWLSGALVVAVDQLEGLPLPLLWVPAVAGGQSVLAAVDAWLVDH